MSILLYRVDERLVHGQVVLGWGGQLSPNRYLVIDEEVAASAWEQELYQLAVPDSATALFHDLRGAQERLDEWQADSSRSVLLTRGLQPMMELARTGMLRGRTVNLGGMHHGEGRRKLLPYLYIQESDLERIRWLEAAGVAVVAQDLPGASRVNGRTLIERGSALWNG